MKQEYLIDKFRAYSRKFGTVDSDILDRFESLACEKNVSAVSDKIFKRHSEALEQNLAQNPDQSASYLFDQFLDVVNYALSAAPFEFSDYDLKSPNDFPNDLSDALLSRLGTIKHLNVVAQFYTAMIATEVEVLSRSKQICVQVIISVWEVEIVHFHYIADGQVEWGLADLVSKFEQIPEVLQTAVSRRYLLDSRKLTRTLHDKRTSIFNENLRKITSWLVNHLVNQDYELFDRKFIPKDSTLFHICRSLALLQHARLDSAARRFHFKHHHLFKLIGISDDSVLSQKDLVDPQSAFAKTTRKWKSVLSQEAQYFALICIILFYSEDFEKITPCIADPYAPKDDLGADYGKQAVKAIVKELINLPPEDQILPLTSLSLAESLRVNGVHEARWPHGAIHDLVPLANLYQEDSEERLRQQQERISANRFTYGVRRIFTGIHRALSLRNEKFQLEVLNDADTHHVTIVVSGFTSENDYMPKEWRGILEFPNQGTVLSLRWQAATEPGYVTNLSGKIGKAEYDALLHSQEMRIAAWVSTILLPVCGVHLYTLFTDTESRAIQAGADLGRLIASGNFGTHQISLMGFSLGTKVIFEALEYLSSIPDHAKSHIQNVYLLGGAIENIPGRFNQAVGVPKARIVNCYSKEDSALSKIYGIIRSRAPAIGISPILSPKIENFDVSQIVKDHDGYRPNLGQLLEHINYTSF